MHELDLDSSDEEDKMKKRMPKLKNRHKPPPQNIIPDPDSDSDSSDDERVTAVNMESRARALDEEAMLEAQLDDEELLNAAALDGENADMDELGDGDGEGFVLPSIEEREIEKQRGGPELADVQHRMQICARVLSNFKKLGARDRSVIYVATFQ